jgi:hypothetical protein
VSDLEAWLAAHTAGAPPALRTRAEEYLARTPAEGSRSTRLAAAATLALDHVLGQGRARAAALDLLTADGLLTLALLSQAETAPGELGGFAADLVSRSAA